MSLVPEVLRFDSPGAVDLGAAPDLADPLVYIGDQLAAHSRGENDREALSIPNVYGELERMRHDPGPWDEALRCLISGALSRNPDTRTLQIQRYVKTPTDGRIRAWHTDLALPKPSRRLSGEWEVPTDRIKGAVGILVMNGLSPLAAKGTIVEERPTSELPIIRIPRSSAESAEEASMQASALQEAYLENTPETVVGRAVPGQDPYLIRWRVGETSLLGENIEIQSVLPGRLMEMKPETAHIPPEELNEGRVVLIAGAQPPFGQAARVRQSLLERLHLGRRHS